MGEQNSELLLSMLRDLGNKVDGLPTRHELDILNGRFDAIENAFDKYVLSSEFTTYKDYAEQRLKSEIKSVTDAHNNLADTVDGHDKDLEKFKANRLPSWVFPVVLSVATIIVQIWGNLAHNNTQAQVQQQLQPQVTVQRIK